MGKSYILKPEGLGLGNEILASDKAEAKVGNCIPLRNIPVGFFVHNVELYPGGWQICTKCGSAVQLVGKEDSCDFKDAFR